MCCGKWKHKPQGPDRERNTFGKEELGKAAQAAKPKVAKGAEPSADPPTLLPASQGLALRSASPVPSPNLHGSSAAGLWEPPLQCSANPGDTRGTPTAAGAVGERGRARSAPGRRREDSPAPLAPHGTCLPCRAQSCVTAAHSSAHNKQRLIATAVAAALQRCGVFGWEPTCPQNAPGETLGISAVSSRVTRATHNYAGVSRGRGNASSFKLSLEYRGLVLTMQQRF